MSLRVLLVGPKGHGGEEVYVNSMRQNPPAGVTYQVVGDFHHGTRGAPCNVVGEVMLNRLVYPLTIPDIGFRSLRLGDGFDLVHVHAHPTRLARLGSRPLVMSEGSSPVVYVEHYLGWDEARLTKGLKRSRRLYRLFRINDRLLGLERVSRVYVFSEWARKLQLRWGANAENLDVIYPGFITPQLPDRRDRTDFRYLFVGRDFERKGGFEVIEAFDLLLERFPEAMLVIAGSDPAERNPDRLIHSWVDDRRRERVLMRLEELRRSGRVELHTWIDRRVLLNEIYPRADAFVMPPHAEGFGFTNVEALSFGLPVITSTVGPAAEIVSSGRTGLLVEPGDVAALAAAMIRLVENLEATRQMGEAARAEFLARFTLERFRIELGDFYRRALEA